MPTPYSLDSYRSILAAAKSAGWTFAPFSLDEPAPSGKRIYLRHDVDYSLAMALKMAEVNAGLGIAGTFFVLLRSRVYNLLSDRSLELAAKLHSLGQHVGLHVPMSDAHMNDPALLDASLAADYAHVRRDLAVLEPVFAWHNTPDKGLEKYLGHERIGGLVSAHSKRFFKDIAYYSDTNMRHPVESFLGFVRDESRPMQLLFHPLNWVAGGATMKDVFANTWAWLLREPETELSGNRAYSQLLPAGLPAQLVDEFVARWRAAVSGGSK